jgi:Photoprotection regulator fluorescence recovery protein
MAEFKARANAATTSSDMWKIESYLRGRRREMDATFDYRYSRFPLVFAHLIYDGHLDESRLTGLSEEKLQLIRSCLSLREG